MVQTDRASKCVLIYRVEQLDRNVTCPDLRHLISCPSTTQHSRLFLITRMSTGHITKSEYRMKYKRAITFGTFDLFHVGHVRILQRVSEMADQVIVGISSDQLNLSKKGRLPICTFSNRAEILLASRFVSEVFKEESLDKKREYIQSYNADLLVMGDDWEGKFDFCADLCHVVYLPRTEMISTTEIISDIVAKRSTLNNEKICS